MNGEEDDLETDSGLSPNMERLVRNAVQSFRERKLKEKGGLDSVKEEDEDKKDVRLNVNEEEEKEGLDRKPSEERDFAEKSDPYFRGKELNRDIGSPSFPENY